MEEITLNSWNDFISCLREIKSKYSQYTINDEPHVYNIAYRGQADSKWPLLTTLERYTSNKQWFLREYLELVLNCVPQIEAFTDKKWSLPTQSNGDILNDIFDSKLSYLSFRIHSQFLEFLVYLRHHNFPSPLLDWSMSPYVAVFFAFSEIIPADMASVFVFIETPTGNKSGFLHEPQIFQYGQHCRTHKRHFLQQACYTIAAKLYTEDGAMEPSFVRHQKIFSQGNNDQDLLFKINIPCSERIKILSHLDEYNVNHFSLIQSEESLVRMVAFREMEKYFNSSIIK